MRPPIGTPSTNPIEEELLQYQPKARPEDRALATRQVEILPAPSRSTLAELETMDLALLGADGNPAFNLLEKFQSEWRQHKERGRRQSLALDFLYAQLGLYATTELRRQALDAAHEERTANIGYRAQERDLEDQRAIEAAGKTVDRLVTFFTATNGKVANLKHLDPLAAKQLEGILQTLYRNLHTLAILPGE